MSDTSNVPQIRSAEPPDAPMLARLHVQAWRETYPGLLPEAEIAARGYEVRLEQWERQLGAGKSTIVLCPGLGFAQMGAQRDEALMQAGYPQELWCLYLINDGQGRGIGRALMDKVVGNQPFTALVLATNQKACGFYRAIGGIEIDRRAEHVGMAQIEEIAFGFGGPE